MTTATCVCMPQASETRHEPGSKRASKLCRLRSASRFAAPSGASAAGRPRSAACRAPASTLVYAHARFVVSRVQTQRTHQNTSKPTTRTCMHRPPAQRRRSPVAPRVAAYPCVQEGGLEPRYGQGHVLDGAQHHLGCGTRGGGWVGGIELVSVEAEVSWLRGVLHSSGLSMADRLRWARHNAGGWSQQACSILSPAPKAPHRSSAPPRIPSGSSLPPPVPPPAQRTAPPWSAES